MTAQATRDALAEMDGYKREPAFRDDVTGVVLPERWYKNGRSHPDGHPHPPTMDAAHAAITAAGWKWERYTSVWLAWRGAGITVEVPDTGDPVNDLWTLTMACRKAMEEKA